MTFRLATLLLLGAASNERLLAVARSVRDQIDLSERK
jgi:hypothetical protein